MTDQLLAAMINGTYTYLQPNIVYILKWKINVLTDIYYYNYQNKKMYVLSIPETLKNVAIRIMCLSITNFE